MIIDILITLGLTLFLVPSFIFWAIMFMALVQAAYESTYIVWFHARALWRCRRIGKCKEYHNSIPYVLWSLFVMWWKNVFWEGRDSKQLIDKAGYIYHRIGNWGFKVEEPKIREDNGESNT